MIAVGAVVATQTASSAAVVVDSAWVVALDGGKARKGLLTRDSVVSVYGCEDGGEYAVLDGEGQVPCAVLSLSDAGRVGAFDPPLRWAEVKGAGARVHALPSLDAGILETVMPPRALALIDEPRSQDAGFLRRASGGYVSLSEVALDKPSDLAGEREPRMPLAFVIRATPSAGKFERFEVLAEDAKTVTTVRGVLPRSSVRVAYVRSRPDDIPAESRWVDVDLTEQVLVAYEGSEPVFATVVSTGVEAKGRATRRGLFRVWLKALHDRMHGEGYFVEEVPRILYFSRGQALHGSFWHNRFGEPVSHGCINLSLADAQWLFDWAPPRLPPGWHTVFPDLSAEPTLWVLIEHRKVL